MNTSVSNEVRELFLQSTLQTVDSVLSAEGEKIMPSESFEKKMRKILRETRKEKTAHIIPSLPAKKWAAIALIAALLLSLVGCAWAHSEEIVEFLQVLFEKDKLPDAKATIKTFFDCTYIPEGFVYDVKGSDGWDEDTQTRSIWKYWRNGHSMIRFNQRIRDLNIVSQPSPNSQIWYETIDGTERTFWICRDDELIQNYGPACYSGTMGCFWTDGYCDYEIRFYRFYDSDKITLDEFMKIVNSIIPVYTLPSSDA